MKKIIYIIISHFTLFSYSVFALDCPPSEKLKELKLISATQYFLDPDAWNFASQVVEHKGVLWNV